MCGHCGCGSEAKTTALDLQTGKEIAMETRAHDHDASSCLTSMNMSMGATMSMCTPMGPDILTHIAPMMRPARIC